jgi:Zn-dependent M28 family amino/carboxypeptidase
MLADNDPDPNNHSVPVPGANDGASGVAVLLELARTLPSHLENTAGANLTSQEGTGPGQIWLVFFDAEDNGNIPGWDWILGSRAFVAGLEETPDAAVIVDMIGDADLNIYQELNSDPGLTEEIWSQAQALGYSDRIIPEPKYRMIDDHTPFIEAGIPAVDLIDFDYPYWHTIADTPDKVSAESLQIVGDTLIAWLKEKTRPAN